MKLTNAVIPEFKLKQIIGFLRKGSPKAKGLANELADTWKRDEEIEAYQALACDGLSDSDFDRDDNPAVSPGDDPGAYVQIWQWVSVLNLPDEIRIKLGWDEDCERLEEHA